MSQAKLQAARELIKEKQFETARHVLKTMREDPTAAQWLKKLPKKRGVRWGVILPVVTFFVGVAIGFMPSSPRIATTAPTLAALAPVTTVTTVFVGTATVVPPTATITNTLTPSIVPSPTDDLTLTQAWISGEQTRAAHGLNMQSTVIAWTRNAPTPVPPFNPVTFQGTIGQVFGPLTLPAGMYRARVTTAGYFIAHLQITSGECGEGIYYLSPGIFSLTRGQGNGAEVVIRSTGCTTFIETSNITDAWTLEITKIG